MTRSTVARVETRQKLLFQSCLTTRIKVKRSITWFKVGSYLLNLKIKGFIFSTITPRNKEETRRTSVWQLVAEVSSLRCRKRLTREMLKCVREIPNLAISITKVDKWKTIKCTAELGPTLPTKNRKNHYYYYNNNNSNNSSRTTITERYNFETLIEY